MNNFSENKDLTIRLNNIFRNKFDIDLLDNDLNLNVNDNLLGPKFKFRARDLVYLLCYIENEFDIEISESDIEDVKFNTITNIVSTIEAKLDKKKAEAV